MTSTTLPTTPKTEDFFDDFLVIDWTNAAASLTTPFGWLVGTSGNCGTAQVNYVMSYYNGAIEFVVQTSAGNVCKRSIAPNDGTNFIGTNFKSAALRDNLGTYFETRLQWEAGTLGSTSSKYDTIVGFGSFGTGAEFCTAGGACIYMRSQPAVYSGHWQCASKDDADTTTTTDCGTGPALSTYQKLRITSIAGPGWRCSVNGVACPDVTTNVADYGTSSVDPRVFHEADDNTDTKKIIVDYVKVHQ